MKARKLTNKEVMELTIKMLDDAKGTIKGDEDVILDKDEEDGLVRAVQIPIDKYGLQTNTFLEVIDELANETTRLVAKIESLSGTKND